MSETGLAAEIVRAAPSLKGRVITGQNLAELMWFRVGGPAEVLYQPADENDLSHFLAVLDDSVPVTVIGLGSNLLVRDGGIRGVVIRLGRGFSQAIVEDGSRIRTGTAVPDARLARVAADAGIDGLAFYRGIPGSIGGALRMNAGAHGGETREFLVEVKAVDRRGRKYTPQQCRDGLQLSPQRCRSPISFSPRRSLRAARASQPKSSPPWMRSRSIARRISP